MGEAAKGVAAMVAACTVWGLSPLYYRLLVHVPPLELLSHRTLWSVLVFGVILGAQGRFAEVVRLLSGPDRGRVALSAVLISSNWFLFIWSVQAGRVTDASLGYYIFPLIAVLLGRLVFAERLGRLRGAAVALAVVAVAVMTIGLGVPPTLALAIGTTFGIYGVLKKGLTAGPVASVTAEVAVLAIPAAIWLVLLHGGLAVDGSHSSGQFGADLATSALLALSGVLTAGPLILFSYASRRVSMAALGLMQYINPTLQFLCAVAIFREPFTAWHLVAFGLIWAALVLYSVGALRSRAAGRG